MRFQSGLLLIMNVVCSLTVLGQDAADRVCEDLHKFTCAPGIYDDGTGKASNSTALANRRSEIVIKALGNAKADFSNALVKEDNLYFRRSLLSATGLSMSPDCKNGDKKPTKACITLMAEGATQILYSEQYSTEKKFSEGAIEDLSYFTDSTIFKEIHKKMTQTLKKDLKQEVLEKKVQEKVFPKVKELLLAKIENMVAPSKTRDQLIEKVRAIRYTGSNCKDDGSSEGEANTIPDIMVPNAFYDPVKNTFKYCVGMGLTNDSEFQMAYIIGHELTHSIDPCSIAIGPSDYTFRYSADAKPEAELEFPFPGLISCLRSGNSIGAKVAPQYQELPTLVEPNSIEGTSPPQPPAPKTHFFCGNDQITESFADWMSAEILPEYISIKFPNLTSQQLRLGYSNLWRGNCEPENRGPHMGFAVHPPQNLRLNKIILAQPKIRAQMNCPVVSKNRQHCSVTTESTECKSCTPKNKIESTKEGAR